VTRAEALARYEELPVPDTTMEPWRFTDLTGFDPDSFSPVLVSGTGTGPEQAMLDIAVAGVARVSEAGIRIEKAPEGVTFEPLTREADRLGTLVGAEDKFTAHNAARWEHGLLVRVPKGVELDAPLYVKITNTAEGG
jgi:Fe-S cluster assembly scaffold protein SufB